MANTNNSINRSSYGRRRVGSHGGTVSIASIAWVVANLLTLSQPSTCVSAFTHSQKTRIRNARIKNVKREFQPRSRCPSSLNYCNIESQPTLKDIFQQCHVEIFRLPNMSNTRRKTLVRSQMNDDQNFSSDIDHQFIVDEYLESIDRRYKRVHQSETKNDRSQRNFTNAWAWLAADESSLIEEVKQRNKEDALCVLGLAELASGRLLQKHNLPVKQSQQLLHKGEDSIIIDVQGEKNTTTPSIRAALVAKSFARILNSMKKAHTYRRVVVSLQLRAWFYHTLRRSGSTFTQFLAAFSLMSRCMTSGRLASQFAILVACAIVVTRPFKA